jgi:hypothetical protein
LGRTREMHADEMPVDDGVGHPARAKLLTAAGYAVGIVLIIWGIGSGEPLFILLGLVILAILVRTTDG